MGLEKGEALKPLRHTRIGPSPRLLLLCALPLSLLIVAIVVDQFWRQQSAMLSDLERVMNEQRHGLETLVSENDQQLARMRLAMEDRIADARGLSKDRAGELKSVLVKLNGSEMRGLEWEPGARNAALGSLYGIPELAARPSSFIGPVDAALDLLTRLHIDKKAGSRSHSSFFFSAQSDFIAIYPGLSLQALATVTGEERPIHSIGELFASFKNTDAYQLATPQHNERHVAYWTKIFEDPQFLGLMVSHAAPVYVNGQFYGIVGTNIRLEAFESLISRMTQPVGMLAIANDQGEIIAINGKAFNGDLQRMTDYIKRSSLLQSGRPNVTAGFEEFGDNWVRIQAAAASPYRLIYVLPKKDLNAYLLPRFAPYAMILIGLGLTLFGMFYLLHRAYIAPSLKLAEFLTLQAAGIETPIPPLPSGWRRHFLTIAGIVSTIHRYQARLEESEARFLAATSSLDDGFAIADREGKLVFYNEAFAGHLADDNKAKIAMGCDIAALIDLDKFNADDAEIEYTLPDGRWIDGWQSVMPDGGKVILLHDITEAKRTEMRIRESEARYRVVIDTQTEMVARHDPNGRTTFANDAYCRYLGLTLEELLNRQENNFDTIVPEDRQIYDDHVASLTPEAPSATIVIRNNLIHSGEMRWEEWTDTGIFNSEGKLVEIQSMGRDITETRRAEEALSASEARMAAFLEYAPVAMLAKDRNGIFTLVNPETAKRLGRPAHEIIGKRTVDILPASEAEMMDRSIDHVLRTGEMQIEEQYHPSLAPYLYSMFIRFPVRSESGEVIGAGVFAVDQTNEKLVEIELEKQRNALQQSEKLAALGSLLAGVAHELNNPLSIVVGYAGMLHEMATDEPTKRRTKELHSAAERCARIVKTFLSMARSKPIEKRNVSIDAVLDDVLELAAYGLRSNGVTVERERLVALPDFFADPDQLHQVFMNVIINAQQAVSGIEGERKLNVKTYRGRGHIVIDILDSGPGIDDAARARAFEPFFTTKPQGVGTGIGLSVCLRIVEAHGGTISLDAASAGGTLCRIKLPMAPETARKEAEEAEALFRLAGRLLVVDDEATIGAFLVDALGAEGVQVTAVPSGREAQAIVLTTEFDAVITDLRMPDIDGDKLIEFILEKRPELKGRIVVMTGDALNAQGRFERTDLPIIAKPIDIAALRGVLRPLLDKDIDATTRNIPRHTPEGVN